MPKEKRGEKKKRLYQDKISLHPLKFDEALTDVLQVKPEPKDKPVQEEKAD